MNRKDLIRAIADNSSLTQDQVKEALTVLVDVLALVIKYDDSITINGFGKFIPKITKGGTYRNPKTGQFHDVPMRKSVIFKPSGEFKTKLTDNT